MPCCDGAGRGSGEITWGCSGSGWVAVPERTIVVWRDTFAMQSGGRCAQRQQHRSESMHSNSGTAWALQCNAMFVLGTQVLQVS
jgi:hypothetical protein